MAEETESKPNIYQRINAVMKEVDYVQKDATIILKNGRSYKAITHDNVVAHVRASMVEHGIIVKVVQCGGRIIIERDVDKKIFSHMYEADYKVLFVNIDNPGDVHEVVFQTHAEDPGDKAPGKAASMAVKYAILKTFLLETGENEESRTYEEPKFTQEQKNHFDELLELREPVKYLEFIKMVGEDAATALYNSFEKGKITAGKSLCNDLERDAFKQLEDAVAKIEAMCADHNVDVLEHLEPYSTGFPRRFVGNRLSESAKDYIKSVQEL